MGNKLFVIREGLLIKREGTGPLTESEINGFEQGLFNSQGYECRLPAQVHEILIHHGKMKDPVLTHCGEESREVSSSDWIYRTEFKTPGNMEQHLLTCRGLDTIADIYLNGEKIGEHRDMFYPFRSEVSLKEEERNVLVFHFHSPVRHLEEMRQLHSDCPYIDPAHYIRKAPHDFEDFLGIKPYFASVGIFDEVVVESWNTGRIEELHVSYRLDKNLETAAVEFHVTGQISRVGNYTVHCAIEDEKGRKIFERAERIYASETLDCRICTEALKVDLWWPRGYGRQPIYSCSARLLNESVISQKEKRTGFRLIEFKGPFDLYMNHIAVKLWGANLVPLNGLSHCFDRGRAKRLITLALNANMNILRFWGGGEPYPDELYEMADRAGIMVWGEFFHKWGMYPEDEEYMELYGAEACYMLKEFRHHPALVMWCGGNECRMGADMDNPSRKYVGDKIFSQYGALIEEFDPEKFYLSNSPDGGSFANDPREGDFHGWNHLWYVPYDRYPVMFSENSRVSPPILKSLEKYIPDPGELWPEGFVPRHTRYGENLLPPAWMKLKTGPEPYWCSPVEQFYDAGSPGELIYQCQAAHGKLMKQIGERIRRGKPANDPEGERRCKGQLIWKFNDSWPQIFCSLLDYDMEGGIPYYTVKRVFEPLHVSFDIEEHITIWAVNDSRYDFEGTMEFVLFHPMENKVINSMEKEVIARQGQSVMICDLDFLTQFKRENLLYACLKNKAGEVIARNYEFVEIERNFCFPDAKLSLGKEGDYLVVSTDKFARSIELGGTCNNGEERFLFEDNYFDLLPFEQRKIRIDTGAERFTVTAKPFYSTKNSTIEFIQEEKNEV